MTLCGFRLVCVDEVPTAHFSEWFNLAEFPDVKQQLQPSEVVSLSTQNLTIYIFSWRVLHHFGAVTVASFVAVLIGEPEL